MIEVLDRRNYEYVKLTHESWKKLNDVMKSLSKTNEIQNLREDKQ